MHFQDKISNKFREMRLVTHGGKPDLVEWAHLIKDDDDFSYEFQHVFDNVRHS